MDETAAIRTALANIGLGDVTIDIVIAQGVESYDSICQLSDTLIDDMVKFVMRNHPPEGVYFPYLVVQRFKAIRYFVDEGMSKEILAVSSWYPSS